MPRKARLDAPGTLHHVIMRGIEKRRIVDDQKDRKNFVSRMGHIASETDTLIYAWALMPNHAHILLRSSHFGLPNYMRRLLTGYAIGYNLRHKRHGHLFQNRYKSIICEEDAYFKELVRYIHLNPLRGGMVKTLGELERYAWCGHGVVMGKCKHKWQDRDYVLSWFGKREGEAKKGYSAFVQKGIALGRRLELVGGGLIRSLGGWSQVKTLRRIGMRARADDRILGDSEFVASVINEAENKLKYQFPPHEHDKEVEKLIKKYCKDQNIRVVELKGGSRRRKISQIRRMIAQKLVKDYGMPSAEAARQLGVTTSAISKLLNRSAHNKST
jgi:REP element-mobilizing transposase RayT